MKLNIWVSNKNKLPVYEYEIGGNFYRLKLFSYGWCEKHKSLAKKSPMDCLKIVVIELNLEITVTKQVNQFVLNVPGFKGLKRGGWKW